MKPKSSWIFYSTVDRYQDRVRCLMLSNAVSIMNPYFIRFHIEPKEGISRHADGFIVTDFVNSEQFQSEVGTHSLRFIHHELCRRLC